VQCWCACRISLDRFERLLALADCIDKTDAATDRKPFNTSRE
jgi:hypothetical protein